MKMKTKFVTMAIIAIIGLATAIIACKEEDDPPPPPEPVAQSKTLTYTTVGGTANVIINYTALPNTEPSYMPTLETVLDNVVPGTIGKGNLTINVIASGGDGFTLTGSKTVSVRESWIANATEMEMGISLDSVKNSWIAE